MCLTHFITKDSTKHKSPSTANQTLSSSVVGAHWQRFGKAWVSIQVHFLGLERKKANGLTLLCWLCLKHTLCDISQTFSIHACASQEHPPLLIPYNEPHNIEVRSQQWCHPSLLSSPISSFCLLDTWQGFRIWGKQYRARITNAEFIYLYLTCTYTHACTDTHTHRHVMWQRAPIAQEMWFLHARQSSGQVNWI